MLGEECRAASGEGSHYELESYRTAIAPASQRSIVVMITRGRAKAVRNRAGDMLPITGLFEPSAA